MDASEAFSPALHQKASATHPVIRIGTPDLLLKYIGEQREWLQSIYERAKGGQERLPAQIFQSLISQVNARANQVQSLISAKATQESFQEAFALLVRQFEAKELIHSHSRIGRFLDELSLEDPWHALRVAGSYCNVRFVMTNTDQPSAWSRAAATALLVEKGLYEKAPNLDGVVTEFSNRWDAQFQETERRQTEAVDAQNHTLAQFSEKAADGEASILGFKEEAAKNLSDGIAQLEAVRETYKAELTLQAPTTYWRTKQINHLKAAGLWAAGFAGSAVAGGLLVWHVWDITVGPLLFTSSQPGQAQANPQYGMFLPTVAVAFLVVWILRIFSGQLLANFAMSSDAGERVAMVKTFLALMQKPEHVKENDRILILSSLFRSAPSSNEDATPPNWFDILMQRVNKQ